MISVIFIMVGHFDCKHRCHVEKNAPIRFILPNRWQNGAESLGIETTSCLCLYLASTPLLTKVFKFVDSPSNFVDKIRLRDDKRNCQQRGKYENLKSGKSNLLQLRLKPIFSLILRYDHFKHLDWSRQNFPPITDLKSNIV